MPSPLTAICLFRIETVFYDLFFVVDTEKAVPLTLEQDYAKRLIRSAKAH